MTLNLSKTFHVLHVLARFHSTDWSETTSRKAPPLYLIYILSNNWELNCSLLEGWGSQLEFTLVQVSSFFYNKAKWLFFYLTFLNSNSSYISIKIKYSVNVLKSGIFYNFFLLSTLLILDDGGKILEKLGRATFQLFHIVLLFLTLLFNF